MMKNFTTYLIILLQASVFCNAQTWVKTSAPTNIRYKGIRTYGNNIVYAYGISGSQNVINTLVSSFDGGQTWTVGTISSLYTVYLVATPAGLVAGNGTFSNPTSNYTADGGQTWNKVTGTESGYFFPSGILPNGKLLYSDQLYKSLSVSQDYLSLGTKNDTSVTPDFRYFATSPSGRIILGHDGNYGYDLAYSDDNGATLTNISLKNIIGTDKQAPMITYAGNNTFYSAGVNTNVLKSTDNGITWSSCTPIPGTGEIVSIKANNTSGTLLVSKAGNNFVMSKDDGQTFSSVANGLPANGNGMLEVTTDGKFWLSYEDSAGTVKSGGIYYLQDNLAVSDTEKKNFVIYPNPAKDVVNLDNLSKNVIVKIMDATGKLIYNSKANDSKHIINTTHFANGIYFIEVNDNGEISSKKLIIRK